MQAPLRHRPYKVLNDDMFLMKSSVELLPSVMSPIRLHREEKRIREFDTLKSFDATICFLHHVCSF
jgi:hypothetical protein